MVLSAPEGSQLAQLRSLTRRNLAQLLESSSDLSRAALGLEAYTEVLQEDPGDVASWRRVVHLAARVGNGPACRLLAEQAVLTHPSNQALVVLLREVLEALGPETPGRPAKRPRTIGAIPPTEPRPVPQGRAPAPQVIELEEKDGLRLLRTLVELLCHQPRLHRKQGGASSRTEAPPGALVVIRLQQASHSFSRAATCCAFRHD